MFQRTLDRKESLCFIIYYNHIMMKQESVLHQLCAQYTYQVKLVI